MQTANEQVGCDFPDAYFHSVMLMAGTCAGSIESARARPTDESHTVTDLSEPVQIRAVLLSE